MGIRFDSQHNKKQSFPPSTRACLCCSGSFLIHGLKCLHCLSSHVVWVWVYPACPAQATVSLDLTTVFLALSRNFWAPSGFSRRNCEDQSGWELGSLIHLWLLWVSGDLFPLPQTGFHFCFPGYKMENWTSSGHLLRPWCSHVLVSFQSYLNSLTSGGDLGCLRTSWFCDINSSVSYWLSVKVFTALVHCVSAFACPWTQSSCCLETGAPFLVSEILFPKTTACRCALNLGTKPG